MSRPLRVTNWGSINATELVTPVPFQLVAKKMGEERSGLKEASRLAAGEGTMGPSEGEGGS
eukprot:scaffold274767_cov27-Tisochrysis_lutea.AAC.4